MNVTKLLAAVLACVTVLLATISDAPIPSEYAAGIKWALGGVAAGLTTFLGPEIADAIKSALKGKPEVE